MSLRGPLRRSRAVVAAALLIGALLTSSAPQPAGAQEDCGLRLDVLGGSFHTTAWLVRVEGVCDGSAEWGYSWTHNAPCGNFIVSKTDQGKEHSRADWFHRFDWGCPAHEDLEPHSISVSVTVVTSGNGTFVCSAEGIGMAQNPCGSSGQPPEEPQEEGRVTSSRFPLATRMEKAREKLKPLIDPMVAEYNSVAEELLMQQRALDELAELHAFRVANVETIETQISELRQDIADGISRADNQEMLRLQEFLRSAQLEEFAVRLRLRNKERVVEELVVRREGMAAQLLIHSQPLQAIDFELVGLVVAADSTKVYEVDVVSPYARLFELTRKIREQRQNVEELLAEKKAAFKEFQATHQAASRRLREIAELIWSNAKKAAAVDFASNAIDVMIAGSKGGWAGVISELTSKVYETYFKAKIAAPIGDPNPGKEAVEAWFRESVAGTVGSNALALGIERAVKETGVKLVKDFVGDALADEFPALRPSNVQGVGPSATADALRRARGGLARLKDLVPKMETETFRKGFGNWVKGSVGRKLITDATKSFFKTQLKNAEMAAWMEYIQLEVHAQGWFGIWQAAANAYWAADDSLQGWMLEKDRIMEEFDPETAIGSPTVQESFAMPAALRIRLVVPRSAKPFSEIPVKVFVNGVEASRVSATVFQTTTKNLTGTEFAIEVQ